MKTKDVIIDKAISLFASKGYQSSSIRNICSEVGIKESSFYNHFTSKEELLNTIFDMCEKSMLNSVLTDAEREELTDKFSLRELMNLGINKFIDLWADPLMSRIWHIVSMEQYTNPIAGKLILDEDQRKITGAAATFDKFQKKGKMVECNSLEVAHLYMYSIRAQHLDYGLRLIHGRDAENAKLMMHQTCNLFCSLYQK